MVGAGERERDNACTQMGGNAAHGHTINKNYKRMIKEETACTISHSEREGRSRMMERHDTAEARAVAGRVAINAVDANR